MDRERINWLLSRYFDRDITQHQLEEMEQSLQTSAEARELFWQEAKIHVQLGMRTICRKQAIETIEVQPAKQDLVVTPRSRSWLDRISKHPTPPALVVSLVFVATLLSWAAMTYLPELSGHREPQEEIAEEVAHLATLVAWHEPEWLENTRPPLRDRRLKPGQRLVIATGLLEIQYNTGVKVVIEGPAEFFVGSTEEKIADDEIEYTNSGYLKNGKLVARVDDDNAKGFSIETPSGRVVDLGTEFGVAVNEKGVQMHVLSGSISATFVSADKNANETRILRVNESLGISPEGHIDSKLSPAIADSFVSISKRLLTRSDTQADASDFLIDNPDLILHYQPSKDADTAKLVNLGRGGPKLDATIHGAKWTQGQSPASQVLSIANADDHVRMNLPGEFSKLTIAMWVRVDSLEREFQGLVMSDGWDRSGQVHWQILRSGQIELAIHDIFPRIGFKTFHVEPKRWYHLAVSCDVDAQLASLFVDGRLVDRRQTPPLPKLVMGAAEIGNWALADGFEGSSRHVGGQVGELMIFSRMLNEREVRQCSLAPTQRTPPLRSSDERQAAALPP